MQQTDAQLIFCDGLVLLREGEGWEPAHAEVVIAELLEQRESRDSFLMKPQGVMVMEVSGAADPPPTGCVWARVRQLIAVDSPWAPVACRALGLLNWRSRYRFCSVCGGMMEEHPADVARQCSLCRHVQYPAISPAVIVRVVKEGRILLARHVQRSHQFYTCLAGYVEVGESAEDCVHREVREEAGIEICNLRYAGSQHWPYPNQLMLAFTADWESGELILQADELLDAQWFDPSGLPNIPPQGSVAYSLIHGLI